MYMEVALLFMTMNSINSNAQEAGILYPRASETRSTLSLDGIWNFAVVPENDQLIGFREKWYNKTLREVSIPSDFICLILFLFTKTNRPAQPNTKLLTFNMFKQII